MSHYELVVGLEIHAQLLTKSKMFCRCANDYFAATPNSRVCPVCLGMPGVLPVINQKAVEYVVMTGLALNCQIPPFAKFDRKNYFYPDLVKSYQISEYDLPLCTDGWLEVETEAGPQRLRITRVHLEEDTGKLTHVQKDGQDYSLIDYNRSGVPLMEIVSYHDMHSLEVVKQYITKIRSILRYLGVSSGDMEKGAMRFEANISLRPVGATKLGNRVEVKNLNSFRAVLKSIEYEVERQTRLLDSGGLVQQETMGWDEARGVTVSQRSKEEAHDYRYFPEPDLPPLELDHEWVDGIRQKLPELPDAKRDRFMTELGLSRYDASLLVADKAIAEYFEQAVGAALGGRPSVGATLGGRPSVGAIPCGRPDVDGRSPAVEPKSIANWLLGEMFHLMGDTHTEIGVVKIAPASLVDLVRLINEGTISNTMAKDVFAEMWAAGKSPKQVVAEKGLTQISDSGAIEAVVAWVIARNPQAVADYCAGKEAAIRFLVGQVMKETKGRANPTLVNQLLLAAFTRNGEQR